MPEDNLLSVCTDYFRNSTLSQQEVNALIYPKYSSNAPFVFTNILAFLIFLAIFAFLCFKIIYRCKAKKEIGSNR
ncbi:unnamed protein product [Caenorhabditis brenneri]